MSPELISGPTPNVFDWKRIANKWFKNSKVLDELVKVEDAMHQQGPRHNNLDGSTNSSWNPKDYQLKYLDRVEKEWDSNVSHFIIGDFFV